MRGRSLRLWGWKCGVWAVEGRFWEDSDVDEETRTEAL